MLSNGFQFLPDGGNDFLFALLFVGNFDEKDDKNVDGPDVTGWALTDDEKVAFKGWATGEPEEGW